MATKQPNILILWGDDVGMWNISHFSHGMMGYRTPNIDRVANEKPDVVQRIVKLMGHARRQLPQGGKFPGLDQLFLFVAQLLLASLDLRRRFVQVTHDVDHRLARAPQADIGLVRIL